MADLVCLWVGRVFFLLGGIVLAAFLVDRSVGYVLRVTRSMGLFGEFVLKRIREEKPRHG